MLRLRLLVVVPVVPVEVADAAVARVAAVEPLVLLRLPGLTVLLLAEALRAEVVAGERVVLVALRQRVDVEVAGVLLSIRPTVAFPIRLKLEPSKKTSKQTIWPMSRN